MNVPDHISESLETIFWVTNTWILWCGSGSGIQNLFDPGSRIRDGKTRILDKHPGSATLNFTFPSLNMIKFDGLHSQTKYNTVTVHKSYSGPRPFWSGPDTGTCNSIHTSRYLRPIFWPALRSPWCFFRSSTLLIPWSYSFRAFTPPKWEKLSLNYYFHLFRYTWIHTLDTASGAANIHTEVCELRGSKIYTVKSAKNKVYKYCLSFSHNTILWRWDYYIMIIWRNITLTIRYK
jgi:hypothetical protein